MKRLSLARAAGFLALTLCLLFVFLGLILFGYLPPFPGRRRMLIFIMNYGGMALGAFLCPRFLPLPGAGEKPHGAAIAGIVLAALPNLIVRSLGIDFWTASVPAQMLMSVSTGLLITIAHGLFFLTRLPGGDRAGRWTPLLFAIALGAGVSAPHYIRSLLERFAGNPEAIPPLIFGILKWAAAGIAVFASACVWLQRGTGQAAAAEETGAAETDWPKIIRIFALVCVWDFLNSLLISGGLHLLSNPGWAYLDSIPWATLVVVVLAFFAGPSPNRLLRVCLPPAIALFILMPALTLFRDYPRFIRIMLHLVSIADLVLWLISAVVMAESCRNRAWFYACAVGSFVASFFGGFGQIIGTMIPVGGIFTAALMAAAAVVFAFLGFRLLFPKAGLPAPAEEGSRSPAIDRSRVFKEHGLSPREQEVASLMVMGLDNDSIGEKLCISNPAVRYHIGNIYGKFNIDGKKGGRAAFLAKVLKTQAAESPLFPPGGKLH